MAEFPLALALVAGAVAALNPCGFALLPAYLALLVADPHVAGGRGSAVWRAVRFAGGMTLGFVAVFGVFGAVVAPLAVAVERWLPVVTVGMGLLLVAVGLATLAGRGVGLPGLVPRGLGPTQRWVSQVGYGVGFALVSLSCTVAPFLAVTATALRAGSVPGVVLTFLVYAVGMGSVVLALCLAVALARSSVTSWLRRCSPVISRAGGALLVLAGLYVAWYGGYELRVLAGRASRDPLVAAVTGVQAQLARAVISLGPSGIGVLVLLLVLTGLALARPAAARPTSVRNRP